MRLIATLIVLLATPAFRQVAAAFVALPTVAAHVKGSTIQLLGAATSARNQHYAQAVRLSGAKAE